MATIEDLLPRRTDLSTFLVHFTRDYDDASVHGNLLSILRSRRIEAWEVYGMTDGLLDRFPELADSQKVVCFTETPLEHAWMMCSQIEGRSVQFNGYGLAFTKTWARRRGVNPVWYLDMTRGHDWLINSVRNLLVQAEQDATDVDELGEAPILRLTPFIEQMGNPSGIRKEFWWEREWRYVGDLGFHPRQIVVVFAPEAKHDAIKERLQDHEAYASEMPPFVDARWGLERMIGTLAGIDIEDLGPFPE